MKKDFHPDKKARMNAIRFAKWKKKDPKGYAEYCKKRQHQLYMFDESFRELNDIRGKVTELQKYLIGFRFDAEKAIVHCDEMLDEIKQNLYMYDLNHTPECNRIY